MQRDTSQQARDKPLNARYWILALLSSTLVGIGLVGWLVPQLIAGLGKPVGDLVSEHWFAFLGVGAIIGALNAHLTFAALRRR